MTEPTSTTTLAATSAACGTIPLPLLCALGIDLGALVFGLVGCIIVQCLLPDAKRNFWHIAGVTLGGTLFAGLLAPIATPRLMVYLGEVPPAAAHNLVAATIGGFAQPLLVLARAWVLKVFNRAPVQLEKP